MMPGLALKWAVIKILRTDWNSLLKRDKLFTKSERHALAKLTFNYHRIEKGLTMPDFRLGFGKSLIVEMMDDLDRYDSCEFSQARMGYQHSIGVLHEYRETHKAHQYDLGELGKQLDAFLESHPGKPTNQPLYSREDYFSHTHDDFEAFAASRHTIRHFEGRVPEQDIISAVELASTAPQACNRCFTRVHFYQGQKVQQLLALQNGNRGFGHLCEQLLLVTADVDALLFDDEWHDLQTNAGIFAMNLSYALHYKQVAHCLLNLWRNPSTENRFRSLAAIPANEIPVLCIACGKAAKHFKIADSPKINADEILTIHMD